jgi:hypothetical protein
MNLVDIREEILYPQIQGVTYDTLISVYMYIFIVQWTLLT